LQFLSKWSNKVDQPDTRSAGTQNLREIGKSRLEKGTFINDVAKIWNLEPDSIKNSKSSSIAKRKAKILSKNPFVKYKWQKILTLPIKAKHIQSYL
jgi:hypothetical protein